METSGETRKFISFKRNLQVIRKEVPDFLYAITDEMQWYAI